MYAFLESKIPVDLLPVHLIIGLQIDSHGRSVGKKSTRY